MSNIHILTCTGRQHTLDNSAQPGYVPGIYEIAHSLAQINRFTGHCKRPYSVAEHSLLVADNADHFFNAPPQVQLAALMHDAHECITGDVASPIKAVLGDTWYDFENAQQTNLLQGYGLWETYQQHYALIKQCDLIALATERRDLMPYSAFIHDPWPLLDTPGMQINPRSIDLMYFGRQFSSWCRWADKFVEKFHTLRDACTPQATATGTTSPQPAHHD